VSHDSTGHVEDFVKAALEKELSVICFANHPERMCEKEKTFKIDVPSVVNKLNEEKKEIEICRDKYGDALSIYQGIELENRKSLKEANRQLLENYPFDVVIGSCHLVGDHSVSSKRHLHIFEEADEKTLYSRFFDGTLELIEEIPFDFLGHFDIVKRYGVLYYGGFESEKYQDRIGEIYRVLAEKGIGLEVNTSGFFQDPGEPYPSEELVLEALRKGVPYVMTGSDAHSPQSLAKGFEKLKNISMFNRIGTAK